MKRVVVTGLGAVTPIGNSVSEYLEGLQKGLSGANPITHFDASQFKTQFACELKDFNPEETIDRREIRRMDNFTVYAMASAAEAMANSGLDVTQINADRAGVI